MTNCPNCGGALRVDRDHMVCEYCASPHFPEPNADGVRVLGEAVQAQCPVCRVALTRATVSGAALLHCERCRGVLVDMDTFVAVVDDLRARFAGEGERPRPIDQSELARPVNCPECKREMDTHPYGGPGNIVIDNCPRCRLNWLDYRELSRVVRAADGSDARIY